MSQEIAVTLNLTDRTLCALGHRAAREGVSPTLLLRALLDRILLDRVLAAGTPTGAAVGMAAADTAVATVADVAADVAVGDALALARDWPDLQHRLRRAGLVLRRSSDGGGLDLCRWPIEGPVMALSRLGVSADALALRYGCDFPPDGGAAANRHRLAIRPRFRRADAA